MICPICRKDNIVFTVDFPPLYTLKLNEHNQIIGMHTDDIDFDGHYDTYDIKNKPCDLGAFCPHCDVHFSYGISMTGMVDLTSCDIDFVPGIVVGDIIGSRFGKNNHKSKGFELFTNECKFTGNSIITAAVANAIRLNMNSRNGLSNETLVYYMRYLGKKHMDSGYEINFRDWLLNDNATPYNSCDTGAATRVSPCGYAAKNLEECVLLAREVTRVTHNHPEGFKGAEATSVCIFLAKSGATKNEIREFVNEYYYPMDFTLTQIRDAYNYDTTCQNCVPQAIQAFLECENFEDAIRNAISIGGNSNALASIAGSIAEAYYGVPEEIKNKAKIYLNDYLILDIFNHFYLHLSPTLPIDLSSIS